MGSSNDDDAAPSAAPNTKTQPHLMPQDASQVDPSKLCALTPQVVRMCTCFATLTTLRLLTFSYIDFTTSYY